MKTVIKIEKLSKEYRLGTIGYGTLREDLQGWWARLNGRRDPNTIIGSNINKNLNENRILALDNINLEISEGDRIGIIGKNGAGKSTLLKILSRITTPTVGSAKIRGRVASLLEVGTGFHPELTGRENIYLNGTIYGMTKREIDGKLDEIIEFSGISKYIDTPVKRYSSGMHVRLGFAVAAYLEPEILLVDEILAVGDAEFQKKCLGKMKNIGSQGKTVIFVSHNMNAVESLCDKVIVLVKGKLKFIGNQKEAIQYYTENALEDVRGEVSWKRKEDAPGDDRVRLKAIRIISDGVINANPDVDQEIKVEIEYWNTQPGKRWVGFWLVDSLGYPIVTPSNSTDYTTKPDVWFDKTYPIGLFRSTCIIPKSLLNPGQFSINLHINGSSVIDNIISEINILHFNIIEKVNNNKFSFSKTTGAIRPRLDWNTNQLKEN